MQLNRVRWQGSLCYCTAQSFEQRFKTTKAQIQVTKAQIQVTKTKSKLPYYKVMGNIGSLTKDLQLVRGLSASRSNLERRPSSRGDHCHAGRLLSRESSKKAHLGCHIYGIKWLACSQITCDVKGMHETPRTHNFLCSLTNESWKSHPLLMR